MAKLFITFYEDGYSCLF